MNIITVYAVVCNGVIITTTRKERNSLRAAELLNKKNKVLDYIVIPCNGVVL